VGGIGNGRTTERRGTVSRPAPERESSRSLREDGIGLQRHGEGLLVLGKESIPSVVGSDSTRQARRLGVQAK